MKLQQVLSKVLGPTGEKSKSSHTPTSSPVGVYIPVSREDRLSKWEVYFWMLVMYEIRLFLLNSSNVATVFQQCYLLFPKLDMTWWSLLRNAAQSQRVAKTFFTKRAWHEWTKSLFFFFVITTHCDSRPSASACRAFSTLSVFVFQAGWKENHATFMCELKNLQASGLTTLGHALRTAFDLLNLNRLVSGIDNYGQVRFLKIYFIVFAFI